MLYDVRHQTTVSYENPVRLARFNLRLRPARWPGQELDRFALTIDPVPWAIEDETGPFVVNRSRLVIREPLEHLMIESRFRVDVSEPSLIEAMVQPGGDGTTGGPSVAEVRTRALASRDLSAMGPAGYLYPSPLAPASAAITAWAGAMLGDNRGVIEAGTLLMEAIHREFLYDGSATSVETTPDEAFGRRHGVCQDFAHVMIAAARAHGVPAAYVSGYLRTIPPPGQPRLVGADATHAWACLWCGDELGWIGFDPTNATLARADHIFTAMGRDYGDVAPIDGVFLGGAEQALAVAVDVVPVEG